MSARPRLLLAAAAALLALGAAVLPALPAAADPAVCAGMSGAWDAGTTTCTVSAAGVADTSAGLTLSGNLVIAPAGSVAVSGPFQLIVTGAVEVEGALTRLGGGIDARGGLTITGNGQMTFTGFVVAGALTIDGPGAVLTGSGSAGSIIVLDGTFDLNSTTTGPITNYDTVTASSSVTDPVRNVAGTFTSTGTLNAAVVVDGGTFDNRSWVLAALTVNGGSATNSGFGNVTGTTAIAAGASVTNTATLATVQNAGIFTNAAGATSGAVTNTGSGSLVNDGTINGGVTHTSTGAFTGSGTTIPAYPQALSFATAAPTAAVVGGSSAPALSVTGPGNATTLSASGDCSFAGPMLTYDAIGSCTLTGTRVASGNFALATVTQTFAIAGQPQTVAFTSSAPTDATVGGSSSLAATSTSGDPVSFSSLTPAVCSVAGSTVDYLARGTCRIQGTAAGNAQYASASATQSFPVLRVGGALANSGSTIAGVLPVGVGILVLGLVLLAVTLRRRVVAVRS